MQNLKKTVFNIKRGSKLNKSTSPLKFGIYGWDDLKY